MLQRHDETLEEATRMRVHWKVRQASIASLESLVPQYLKTGPTSCVGNTTHTLNRDCSASSWSFGRNPFAPYRTLRPTVPLLGAVSIFLCADASLLLKGKFTHFKNSARIYINICHKYKSALRECLTRNSPFV